MSERNGGPLWFVKWGGSLITDKRRPATAREDVIARLARELAALIAAHPGRIVLGHGSGSFGHVAAHHHRLAEGIMETAQLGGVSRTQDQAARLHRLVIGALLEAGVATYSVAPGSVTVATGGVAQSAAWEPVFRALELELLPVVFGDVVLDRELGCAILSTENVFVEIGRVAAARRRPPRRVFWLGATDGVLGSAGRPLRRVGRDDFEALAAVAGGSEATDVTGGMRHRLEGAFALLELGAESWIVDGREPAVIDRILAGAELGTRIAR